MSEHDPIDEELMLCTNYSWENFKDLKNNDNSKDSTRRIAVFEHKNLQYVRVYESTSKKYYFRCIECHSKDQEVKAKLSADGLMFKVFEPFSHISEAHISKDTVKIFQDHSCSLQSYAKAKEEQEKISKLRIVQSDEFEYGMNQKHVAKKRLIIFEPNSDRKFCREYSYNIRNSAFLCMKCHPKFVSAKIFKDKNGNEFAEVSNAHRCKPRLYKGIKAEQDSFKNISGQLQIFKSPNFKFLLNAKGVANGRLIIFSTKTEVYEYYRQTNSTYLCLGCDRDPHNIRRKAYVIKDENGNECIKADMSHACEMISYKEVLKSQERIKERHGLL
uniref:Uncharacterized protein n=1 Tax=Panagrolaimus sp. ES5 TaxID=591445 RepID=A0AC34FXG4_9BILA